MCCLREQWKWNRAALAKEDCGSVMTLLASTELVSSQLYGVVW
jgi:hypothetical protein